MWWNEQDRKLCLVNNDIRLNSEIAGFSIVLICFDHECSLQHRGERRGLGGIFFDDLNNYDQEMLLSFATGNCWSMRSLSSVCSAIVESSHCFGGVYASS